MFIFPQNIWLTHQLAHYDLPSLTQINLTDLKKKDF